MIEVKILPGIPVGTAYVASGYPSSGVYTDNAMTYLVDKEANLVYGVTKTVFDKINVDSSSTSSTGISENTLLKTIAIMQNPMLAKELLSV